MRAHLATFIAVVAGTLAAQFLVKNVRTVRRLVEGI